MCEERRRNAKLETHGEALYTGELHREVFSLYPFVYRDGERRKDTQRERIEICNRFFCFHEESGGGCDGSSSRCRRGGCHEIPLFL